MGSAGRPIYSWWASRPAGARARRRRGGRSDVTWRPTVNKPSARLGETRARGFGDISARICGFVRFSARYAKVGRVHFSPERRAAIPARLDRDGRVVSALLADELDVS